MILVTYLEDFVKKIANKDGEGVLLFGGVTVFILKISEIAQKNPCSKSRLNVKSVDKRSAGVYECYIFNREFENETELFESRSYQVKLTYSPDPATNIAFFIMVGSSFIIAFIINLVSQF